MEVNCKCKKVKEKLENLVDFLKVSKKFKPDIKIDPDFIVDELRRVIVNIKD